MVPNDDGSALVPLAGVTLRLGDELDKFAEIIGIGRSIAGIHFKSDNDAGLFLGETIGLEILHEIKKRFDLSELKFHFTVKKFDGTVVKI